MTIKKSPNEQFFLSLKWCNMAFKLHSAYLGTIKSHLETLGWHYINPTDGKQGVMTNGKVQKWRRSQLGDHRHQHSVECYGIYKD